MTHTWSAVIESPEIIQSGSFHLQTLKRVLPKLHASDGATGPLGKIYKTVHGEHNTWLHFTIQVLPPFAPGYMKPLLNC